MPWSTRVALSRSVPASFHYSVDEMNGEKKIKLGNANTSHSRRCQSCAVCKTLAHWRLRIWHKYHTWISAPSSWLFNNALKSLLALPMSWCWHQNQLWPHLCRAAEIRQNFRACMGREVGVKRTRSQYSIWQVLIEAVSPYLNSGFAKHCWILADPSAREKMMHNVNFHNNALIPLS